MHEGSVSAQSVAVSCAHLTSVGVRGSPHHRDRTSPSRSHPLPHLKLAARSVQLAGQTCHLAAPCLGGRGGRGR